MVAVRSAVTPVSLMALQMLAAAAVIWRTCPVTVWYCPEHLLELSQARHSNARLHLPTSVQVSLMPLKQLRELHCTLGGPPISFVNHRLGHPSRLPRRCRPLSESSVALAQPLCLRDRGPQSSRARGHLVHREPCSLVHLAHEALQAGRRHSPSASCQVLPVRSWYARSP